MNTKRTLTALLILKNATAGILLTLICWLAASASAATYFVTSLADSGAGSLREILTTAPAGSTVNFAVSGTITLTTGELLINRPLNIEGPGATTVAISGNHNSRIFKVDGSISVFISGLTIKDGKAANGTNGFSSPYPNPPTPGGPGEPGGAIHSSSTLVLQDCRIMTSAAGKGGAGAKSGTSPSAGGAGGHGGGIYNAGTLTLTNCLVSGNLAGEGGVSEYSTYSPVSGAGGQGGGIYSMGPLFLFSSEVTGNSAGKGGDTPVEMYGANGGPGGGVWSGASCVATFSTISSNSAGSGGHGGNDSLTGGPGGPGGSGGGLFCNGSLQMTNCLVMGNRGGTGGDGGGGAYGSGGTGGDGGSGGALYALSSFVMTGCTVSGNSSGQGGRGGLGFTAFGSGTYASPGANGRCGGLWCGAEGCALGNCIIFDNTAPSDANYSASPYVPSFTYCCVIPLPTGSGNITNTPAFVDYAGGNLRLQTNSPCINAGHNSFANGPVDLDGLPRIVNGTADMGAYESQSTGSLVSFAWLQQFGLPTDGSADYVDSDADGMNTWQEWRCQTCPTNSLSALRLLSPSRVGNHVNVNWQSVAGVNYTLERSTNLASSPAFQSVATNLPGEQGTTAFTDTNSAQLSPLFYRVKVP